MGSEGRGASPAVVSPGALAAAVAAFGRRGRLETRLHRALAAAMAAAPEPVGHGLAEEGRATAISDQNQISLGEFLRRRRRELKLSLRAAAELTGLSNPLISQIENGRVVSPSLQTIGQLALAYELAIFGLERLSRGLPYTGHPATCPACGRDIDHG